MLLFPLGLDDDRIPVLQGILGSVSHVRELPGFFLVIADERVARHLVAPKVVGDRPLANGPAIPGDFVFG